jgi:hypothetical protein
MDIGGRYTVPDPSWIRTGDIAQAYQPVPVVGLIFYDPAASAGSENVWACLQNVGRVTGKSAPSEPPRNDGGCAGILDVIREGAQHCADERDSKGRFEWRHDVFR